MHQHVLVRSVAGKLRPILASSTVGAALTLTLGAAAAPAVPQARTGAATDLKFTLNAVSALSASDAWAVGNHARVLHWNGTTWTQATIPGLPAAVSLNAVPALYPPMSGQLARRRLASRTHSAKTLIVHWDGTAWTRVPRSSPTSLGVSLSSLSMDSATDGWAAGAVDHEQTNTATGLEMHWNGTSWQQVTALPAFIFTGVKSFSASDATAVGMTGPPCTPTSLRLSAGTARAGR